jgi:hypothetical protein
MPLGRYRLKTDLMALYDDDGRLSGELIPAGSIIMLAETGDEESHLISVRWRTRSALVFRDDLKDRTVFQEESTIAC